jgi:uncharacterized membrane protein YphA (DoxX/SURF4 family)
MAKISFWTCALLVLLRLAIGWHFFIEGLEKVNNDSWSSETYLRESAGPLAPRFHELAGDPLAERLTPLPAAPGEDPTKVSYAERFPPALAADWQSYYEHFVGHYGLDDNQQATAKDKLKQAKEQTVIWMLGVPDKDGNPTGAKEVKRVSPYGPPAEVTLTVQERLEEYQKRLKEARELQANELSRTPHTGFEDEVNVKVSLAKADANRMRADLRSDLDGQTAQMKESLHTVVTEEQRAKGPLEEPVGRTVAYWTLLDWTDFVVRWGLLVVGLGLLVGLFTRTWCVAGACFLLLFFLAMPPLPGLPVNPRAEGHYLFVNKNIIEMLALLALATTRSGRWLGLDGIVQFLNPFRRRRAPEAEPAARDRRPVLAG